jgi:hypothetical protein
MTKKSDNDERTEGIHQALIGLVLIILSAVLIILGIRALKSE